MKDTIEKVANLLKNKRVLMGEQHFWCSHS